MVCQTTTVRAQKQHHRQAQCSGPYVHRQIRKRCGNVGRRCIHIEQQVRIVDDVRDAERVAGVKTCKRVAIDDDQRRTVVLQVFEQRREHRPLERAVEPQRFQIALVHSERLEFAEISVVAAALGNQIAERDELEPLQVAHPLSAVLSGVVSIVNTQPALSYVRSAIVPRAVRSRCGSRERAAPRPGS